jgi:hypothetical protein
MVSITKQHVGKYTYLYESTSYRDKQGRPRNKKTKIGKIDPNTNQITYTQKYLQTQNTTTTTTTNNNNSNTDNIKEIIDKTKTYGTYYFLTQLTQKIGLLQTLKTAFPTQHNDIFTLASYLTTQNNPVMYCQDWLNENHWIKETEKLSSQKISQLLNDINETQKNNFYKQWHNHIKEKENIALDISSNSSYSTQRTECEWGHNRDNENLPQTNICLLFGQTSRLPIYQTSYSGSLSDVSTLECTTKKFQALFGQTDDTFIMDKAFYSQKNLTMLLSKKVKFLVSVPFSNNFAKEQVRIERKNIDNIDNIVLTSGEPIRGVHRERVWGSQRVKLHVHIYFDPQRALNARNDLFTLIAKLKELVVSNGGVGAGGVEFEGCRVAIQKYLVVRKSKRVSCGFTVRVREDVVESELVLSGWLVLLSDSLVGVQGALDVYRLRDGVEKGFWQYKSNLGLDRLRVHSDVRAENKLFVAFVALILSCCVYNTLRAKDLFGEFTFERVFLTLAKLKSVCIGGQHVLCPLTRQQKDLFEAFDIPLPVG